MHPWKFHTWEAFDWWTTAFVDQFVEPKNEEIFRIDLKKKKSCNLSKIVSVLLSASVERFFVSRMQDFLSWTFLVDFL